jgi:uncharacterized membrane protein
MEKKNIDNNQAEMIEEDAELKSSLDFNKTKTDHIAVFITDVLGSMKFLIACLLLFIVWISWNIHFLPPLKPFDPFPFPILEMLVSLFAIVLSVSVLINQNRQGKIEQIRRQVEFEVNVRAENEVTKILNMLHEMQQHMGINVQDDKELEEMKEPTDVKQIHHVLDEQELKSNVTKDNKLY